jgi:hypothetical protein
MLQGMKGISGREGRVLLLSVTVSVALGTIMALTFAVVLGGTPDHWSLGELIHEAPLALLFGLSMSVCLTVPLGLAGGCLAVLALRSKERLPPKRWAVRGSVIGAAVGFFPFAVWGIISGHVNEVLLLPVLCGFGGACSGAIVGSILNRFRRTFLPSTPLQPAD